MGQARSISYKKVLVATGIAAAVNASLFAIGSVTGATWDVGQPFLVGIGMVLGATLAPLLLGGLVAKLAVGKWARLQGMLAWGGLAFAIVSSPGGFIASSDLATSIALGLMHVIVGVAWFFGIKK